MTYYQIILLSLMFDHESYSCAMIYLSWQASKDDIILLNLPSFKVWYSPCKQEMELLSIW